MIIVTGGAGFIGSNIIRQLNAKGYENILVVDNLKKGYKFTNIVNCKIKDYCDKTDFLDMIVSDLNHCALNARVKLFNHPNEIEAIIHQGACSDTTEWNGQYVMNNNYEYSKAILHFAIRHRIPFIYASSAAVYGKNKEFIEEYQYEQPMNIYGYSKFLFDQYVRKHLFCTKSQIVGLRYFNVYGPYETHKGPMTSIMFQNYQQFKKERTLKLFGSYDGFSEGEQMRDFIHVEDVVRINLWFLDHPDISGIFNCGTGIPCSFRSVATAMLDFYKLGEIQYIKFPNHLKHHYQSYTQANLEKLRKIGCNINFKDIKTGVISYLKWLDRKQEK